VPVRPSAFQAVRVAAVSATVTVHLPGGARIEVPAEQLDALVAVLEAIRGGPFAASAEGVSC
jgi:hypothetical protein